VVIASNCVLLLSDRSLPSSLLQLKREGRRCLRKRVTIPAVVRMTIKIEALKTLETLERKLRRVALSLQLCHTENRV
jgi:hypothetical protein